MKKLLYILLLPIVAISCRDVGEEDVFPAGEEPFVVPAGAIQISPLDQTLDVEALLASRLESDGDSLSGGSSAAPSVVSCRVTSPETDFLMPLDAQRLYVEQNDDGQWRLATVDVCLADGSRNVLTLAQPPATRASAGQVRRNFLRHHGLGYSYDAVAGKYCDLNYVRCQLLNRAVMDELQDKLLYTLISVEKINKMRFQHSVSSSLVDYIQNSNFTADASLDLIIFEGSVSAACSAFEEGKQESYILHDEQVHPRARYRLEAENIAYYVQRYPKLLTSSFRKAIAKLAATPVDDWQAIDEFLDVYGTHMVNDVELGASVAVDVLVETHKFNLVESLDLLAQGQLSSLFKLRYNQTEEEKNYKVLRNCKCRVDVVGGDISKLDPIIGMTVFSNDDVDISAKILTEWMESIVYDDNDLEHSNVEMTNMRVVPIWTLIPDEHLANRIEARVYSNAASMMYLLGNRNFINVKIPFSQTKYVCRIGNQKYSINNPDVTDVLASGRHVATICLETVPAISEREKVRVAYPIYEGHVKLTNGLCVYKDDVYKVSWQGNSLEVTKTDSLIGSSFDGNLYMNNGALSIKRVESYEYLEGHPILGCERPGGIAIDGSLAGKPVRVVKHFNHFYLKDKERYDNLPNWSWSEELPAEAETFPDYFDATTWKDRMMRNQDYTYIWNTTEIGYE